MDSRLEEFEKKLYKEEEKSDKPKSFEVYKEANIKKPKTGWEKEGWKARKNGVSGRDIAILAGIILFSGAIAFGYYAYYSGGNIFDKKNVSVNISGPETVSAGDQVQFAVVYRNNTTQSLKDAQVFFEWPEKTILENQTGATTLKQKADIGLIVPHQEKIALFKGRIYGSQNQIKEIKVTYRYTPDGFNSVFEDVKTISVKISTTPLALSMSVPAQAVAGKDMDITIEYQNQSDATFPNMEIKLTYPQGFVFVSADPQPDMTNNSVWKLGTVKERFSGKIQLKGNFTGAQGESKSLFAEIGSSAKENEFISYANASNTITIASSALFVFQTANNSRDYVVNPGAIMQYKIRYKNTTDTQIPDVVILAHIDNSYIDIKSLNIQWGSFDSRTNSIIWNGRSVPSLQILDPKEEGEVSFSVMLKTALLPKSFSDKNLTVSSNVKIRSSLTPESLGGLPIDSEDQLDVKVNSQFSFNETAYFRDGPLNNSGPIPPRVNQRTTYAISWQLSNTTNDVDNIEISAVLPPEVEWTGVTSSSDGTITFNKVTGRVVWKPTKVFAGTGILLPVVRMDFQVAYMPSFIHVGQPVNLVSGATLIATDTFTGTQLNRSVSQVNSDLMGTLKQGDGVVSE